MNIWYGPTRGQFWRDSAPRLDRALSEAIDRAEQAEADLAAARDEPEIHVRWDKDGWTNTHPVRLVAETDGYIDWPVSLKVARYQPGGES